MMVDFGKEYDELKRKYPSKSNKAEFIAGLESLIKQTRGEDRQAWVLFLEGMLAYKQDRFDDEVVKYDELLKQFGESQDIELREVVARALSSKGVTLCKQKKYAEAIMVFNEVLRRFGEAQEIELQVRVANVLSNKSFALGMQNKHKDVFAVCNEVMKRFGKAQEIELREVVAGTLINMGVAFGKLEKPEEEIAKYDEVVKCFGDVQGFWFKESVASALYGKGVTFGEMEMYEEAITLYDEVVKRFEEAPEIELKEQVAKALVNKGAAFYNQEKYKKAIALYDEVVKRFEEAQEIELKEQVAKALVNKGAAFYNQEKSKEAIAIYDEVLKRFEEAQEIELKEVVASAQANMSLALDKQRKLEEAFEFATKAFVFDQKKYEIHFRHYCAASGLDYEDELKKLRLDKPDESENAEPPELQGVIKTIHENEPENAELPELQGFIKTIREAYETESVDFLKKKDKAEKRRKNFLKPKSKLNSKKSVLMVLRRWNSYTPAVPTRDDEKSIGGGYFIWHNGKGTVIDPGYNFIENFNAAGCRICDIDNVILTHAHNDHTMDFEPLLVLLHEYNKEGQDTKKVRFFLNNGSFMKFSGLLNLKNDEYTDTIITLNEGGEHELIGGVKLKVLRAYHDELLARDQSVGLFFKVPFGEEDRELVFTSDTGLFPVMEKDGELEADTDGPEVWEKYGLNGEKKPDVMVVHIGSIKEQELKPGLELDPKKACYANHLGIIGTARLITKCRPELAIVSEFGEEMKEFRYVLIRGLQEKVIDVYFKKDKKPHVPRVIPGDLAFIYDIEKKKFYCCLKDTWITCKKTDFGEVKDGSKSGDAMYYFSTDVDKTNKDEFDDELRVKAELFRTQRIGAKGMYFGRNKN